MPGQAKAARSLFQSRPGRTNGDPGATIRSHWRDIFHCYAVVDGLPARNETMREADDTIARACPPFRDTRDTNRFSTIRQIRPIVATSPIQEAPATDVARPGEFKVIAPATAVLPASTQRFSTAAFEPRERVAGCRELYGRTIARLDIAPPADGELMVEATLRKHPESTPCAVVDGAAPGLSR
jgi:hypothetical protein